ncbi:hypothetical protein BKA81DRAFT_395603 [Phyllosticta paracitricarpa]
MARMAANARVLSLALLRPSREPTRGAGRVLDWTGLDRTGQYKQLIQSWQQGRRPVDGVWPGWVNGPGWACGRRRRRRRLQHSDNDSDSERGMAAPADRVGGGGGVVEVVVVVMQERRYSAYLPRSDVAEYLPCVRGRDDQATTTQQQQQPTTNNQHPWTHDQLYSTSGGDLLRVYCAQRSFFFARPPSTVLAHYAVDGCAPLLHRPRLPSVHDEKDSQRKLSTKMALVMVHTGDRDQQHGSPLQRVLLYLDHAAPGHLRRFSARELMRCGCVDRPLYG